MGKVSDLLGIPAVTLRTWEARYGVGPTGRTSGLHRRYTATDIDRLRRMQQLIASGVSAGDAARLSVEDEAVTALADQRNRLLRLAESLAFADLANLLDSCLLARGAAETWTALITPTFRALESRFGRQGDCTDIELVLADAVMTSVGRYLDKRRLNSSGRRPVLLAHCPEERHTLPLVVLKAVLLERGRPVILLGPGTTEAAILQAIARTDPSVVVLFTLARRAGQLRLRNRVQATGCPSRLAGPGWPASSEPLKDLDTAVRALTAQRRRRASDRG